jgi:DNA polymerase-3 subunit delta'
MASNLFNQDLFHQPLPQALLLIGTEHTNALDIAYQRIAQIFCEASSHSSEKNCGTCRACLFMKQKTHPDVLLIAPDKPGAAIKIDQIRALQHQVYQTPQFAKNRMVIIHPANELNRAAANALLKVLEEPPKHIYFMLIATHIDTLPKTIMSRCQVYYIAEPVLDLDIKTQNYLNMGMHYEDTSPRGILFKHQHEIIAKLSALSTQHTSVCALAAEYSKYALADMLWFLHVLTATVLQYQLTSTHAALSDTHLQQLLKQHDPIHYFKQLDLILAFTKKLNQDIPLNPTLTLEALLIGYI